MRIDLCTGQVFKFRTRADDHGAQVICHKKFAGCCASTFKCIASEESHTPIVGALVLALVPDCHYTASNSFYRAVRIVANLIAVADLLHLF